MTGYLLDKIVSDSKETMDKIMEVAPFIVIGVIWLLGAIAKSVQAGKKGRPPQRQQKTRVGQRQPENLADFIRMVKEQYAAAKEQVMEKPEQVSEKVSQIQQTISQPYEESFRRPPVIEVTTPAPMPTVEKPVSAEKSAIEETLPALGPRSFVPEQLGMPGEVISNELAASPERYVSSPYLKDISLQFANSTNLRRAIIYSEILRPPLALRD